MTLEWVMACCMAEKYDGWCKGYKTKKVNGKEYCIFHNPCRNKDVIELQKAIFDRINDTIKEIENIKTKSSTDFYTLHICDFSGAIFIDFNLDNDHTNDIFADKQNSETSLGSPRCCLPNISFSSAKFYGDTSFKNYRFNGYTSFYNSIFYGDVDFSSSEFEGTTSFELCTFGKNENTNLPLNGNAIFNSCKFNDYLRFTDCSFDSASFVGCHFFKDVLFIPNDIPNNDYLFTKFNSEVDFENARFYGKSEFSYVDFFNRVVFEKAYFKDECTVKNCTFSDLTPLASKVHFKSVTFDNNLYIEAVSFCNGLNAKGLIANGKLYFSDVSFLGESSFDRAFFKNNVSIKKSDLEKLIISNFDVEVVDFIECTWPKGKFNEKIIYDEWMYENKNENGISLIDLEVTYRRLKKTALNSHDQIHASYWHFKEKEMQLKQKNPPAFIYGAFLTIFLAHSFFITHIPEAHQLAFLIDMIFTSLSFCLCYWLSEKPLSSKDEVEKLYLQAYYSSSGFGEKPGKAFAVLLALIAVSFMLSLALPELQLINKEDNFSITAVKQWLWYMPLSKIPLESNSSLSDFWKYMLNILIPLQAALFAFALRNKLRR